jgi:hypothetical protein
LTDAVRSPIARPPAGTAPALSKELTDFLVELAVALQRRAMYPGGHPTLAAAEQRLIQRMTPLLASIEAVAVGVARDQLVIDGNATDPRNPHLSGLAERLHSHRLAGFRFADGLTLDELTAFLTRLARDPEELGREPLSQAARFVATWRHITLYRQSYERLELVGDEDGEAESGPRALPRGAQLWLALAQAAMVVDQGGGHGGGHGGGEGSGEGPGSGPGKNIPAETDPTEVAKAINARSRETGYEQAVVGYLIQIAQQLRTTDSTDTSQLRSRVSRLVSDLSPEAVHRLLEMGGNMAQRRTFLNDASAGMATDAVLTLTVAAAEVSQKSISKTLLRLLVKLANHAKRGGASARSVADAAFREHVRDMIDNWTAPNPTPADYERVLDRLTSPLSEPGRPLAVSQACEPERTIEICLELRNAAPSLWDAVNAVIARGDIEQLLDILDRAPADNPLPGVIRGRISTPENFRRVLELPNADPQRVETFAKRVGVAGTDVLLDVLAASQSRAARRKLLALVTHLGDGIGPAIVARLGGAPWFIQRNLLILLGNIDVWPDGFSPVSYGSHADARVRREAIRMMLKRSATRIAALTLALGDSDPQIFRLGIDASQKDCPPGVVPRLAQRVTAGTLPGELQVLAIRALGATRAAAALPCLLNLAVTRSRWLHRERLAPKSAAVLAALSTLAAHWPAAAQVAPMLARAAGSPDPEIRAAVMAPAR